MNKQIANSLFITHFLSIRRSNQLIYQAEQAATFKQNERLVEIAAELRGVGNEGCVLAADFYTGLGLSRLPESRGLGSAILEGIAKGGSSYFRSRALLKLGNMSVKDGQIEQAVAYYQKAGNIDNNWIHATIGRNLAIIQSLSGNHTAALEILDELYPRMSGLDHLSKTLYLHSLAEELNATGKHDEAGKVIEGAARSPFASAYPEIHASVRSIEQARRKKQADKLTNRIRQVERIAAVIYNPKINGDQLRAYADAGAAALKPA